MRRTSTNYALVFIASIFVCLYLLSHWPFGQGRVPVWLTVFLFDDSYSTTSEYAEYVPRAGNSDLQSRLRNLLDAPLESYDSALAVNAAPDNCPNEQADRQAIQDQLRRHSKWWSTITAGQLAKKRLDIVRYLERVAMSGGDVIGRPGGGRGIVMTGGNKDTTERLLVNIRILRFEHRCKLPIEVFTFPGEIDDEYILLQLRALDATVRELVGYRKLRRWKNFQIKADAIIASSFEEVLYLDSDNIPLRDPTYLFDTELYAGEGRPRAVFWSDITKDHPTNPIWRLTGKKCYFEDWQLETGQMVISKTGNNGLNLAALHIAAHMQREHEFYFKLSDGDKDTFRYGFWALDLPYSTAPWWLSTLGFHDDWEIGRFCGIAMVQYDIAPLDSPYSQPKPLFVHANLLKHRTRVNKTPIPKGRMQPTSLSLGSPFTIIKRASNLATHAPSLGAAKLWVYGNQGPCLDVAVRQDILAALQTPDDGNNATSLLGGSKVAESDWKQHVIEERFAEINDGVFREFDRMYRAQGGKDGGWETARDKRR